MPGKQLPKPGPSNAGGKQNLQDGVTSIFAKGSPSTANLSPINSDESENEENIPPTECPPTPHKKKRKAATAADPFFKWDEFWAAAEGPQRAQLEKYVNERSSGGDPITDFDALQYWHPGLLIRSPCANNRASRTADGALEFKRRTTSYYSAEEQRYYNVYMYRCKCEPCTARWQFFAWWQGVAETTNNTTGKWNADTRLLLANSTP